MGRTQPLFVNLGDARVGTGEAGLFAQVEGVAVGRRSENLEGVRLAMVA